MCSADRAPSYTCRVAIYTGCAENVGFAALSCNWHAFAICLTTVGHINVSGPPSDESTLGRCPPLPCSAPIHMYLFGKPGVLTWGARCVEQRGGRVGRPVLHETAPQVVLTYVAAHRVQQTLGRCVHTVCHRLASPIRWCTPLVYLPTFWYR
jgi:hypothetical protein